MSLNFDVYRQEAITLGITDPLQIRDYISHCQNAGVENLIKSKESEKRLKCELDLKSAEMEAKNS